jgi:hypothetical protein
MNIQFACYITRITYIEGVWEEGAEKTLRDLHNWELRDLVSSSIITQLINKGDG